MASLPSKSFMFNYNAQLYNPATHTFPKTAGQLFDEDLVLNKAPNSYTDKLVSFGSTKACFKKTYGSSSQNPFNRDSNNTELTFIYKVSNFDSAVKCLFSNRASGINYSIRGEIMHTQTVWYLQMTPSTNPYILVIRVNTANNIIERKVVDNSGNTLQTVTASTITYGPSQNGFGVFVGGSTMNDEYFDGSFYWMYCSLGILTDAEVLQVIQYNESNLIWTPFQPDSFNFSQSGGTATLTLTGGPDSGTTFEVDWSWREGETAWFDIEPSTYIVLSAGQTTACTITVDRNYDASSRTKTITIWDKINDEVLGFATITQEPFALIDQYHPGKIKFNDNNVVKEYFETRNIMRMYYNGVEVFRKVSYTPTISASESAVSFSYSGLQSTAITVSSNSNWSVSYSGSGNIVPVKTNSTTLTISTVDDNLTDNDYTGVVTLIADNGDFTASTTVNVSQKHYENYTPVTAIYKSSWGWNVNYNITIPIVLTGTMSMRIKYQGTSYTVNNDRLFGYTHEDYDIYGQKLDDNHDWRVFGYSNGSYDVMTSRRSGLYLNTNGTNYDITVGNNYVYNNNTGSYMYQGTSQTVSREAYPHVDVGTSKIKGFEIIDNGTTLFNGIPAIKDGHVGLWDTVTNQLYYNPDLTMTYDA